MNVEQTVDFVMIQKHFNEGGVPDNIISDLEAFFRKYPRLMRGPFGARAVSLLNQAIRYKDQDPARAREALDGVLYNIERYRGGVRRKTQSARSFGSRGRKSHRKSLRQRK